jgi:thiol-disulfide isomerase/thioredoxin
MSTYQVIGTPSAVLIGADGRIASPVAPGGEAIRRLVRRSADGRPMIPLRPAAPARPATGNGNGSYAGPAALPIGSPAPSLAFRDLAGNQVRLDGPRERDALVLFWNPSCGFCQRMADDLRAWAADAPATAPDLIVVSRGTAEENRNLPESATVLLDEGFSAGRSLGASGTPSALLIDREGRIASQLAVGAPSVLELATGGAMVRS